MGDKEFNVAARAASSVLGATAAAAAPGLLGATTASPAPGVEAAGHAMIRAQERQLCTNRLFRTPGVFPRHQIIRVGTNARLFRGVDLRRDLGAESLSLAMRRSAALPGGTDGVFQRG